MVEHIVINYNYNNINDYSCTVHNRSEYYIGRYVKCLVLV